MTKYIKKENLRTKFLGTRVRDMVLAEDRGKCGKLMEKAKINMPEWATAENSEEASLRAKDQVTSVRGQRVGDC